MRKSVLGSLVSGSQYNKTNSSGGSNLAKLVGATPRTTDDSGKTSGYRPNKLTSDIKTTQVSQPKSKNLIERAKTGLQDFGFKQQQGETSGLRKFGESTLAQTSNLIAKTADFFVDISVSALEHKLRTTPSFKKEHKEEQIKSADRFRKQYDKAEGSKPTDKLKDITQKWTEKESLKPSKEWSESSLKDKFSKKHFLETVAVTVPSLISSMGLYFVNPALGLATTVGSTGDDVKDIAIENGVDKKDAEALGISTGIIVGLLDRLVPDELMNPEVKKKFFKGFAIRLAKNSLKEVGTEIAQEDIQLIAEATVREDLGLDEIKERNVMAGFGGLLGGGGGTTLTTTINTVFNKGKEGSIGIEEGKPYDSQEILDIVMDSPLQDTKEGKELIKTALKAKQVNGKVIIGKEIESSVVQIVNTKTNETEYKTIQQGKLEEFNKLIDDTKTGIAGEEIDGKVFHLTAKTPQQMEDQGFNFTGEAKASEIPAKPQPTKQAENKVERKVEELKPKPTKKKVSPDKKAVKPTKTVSKKVEPTKTVKKTIPTPGKKVKASKVAVSIEQNLNKKFENLAGFETINIKDQSNRVSKLIDKDIQKVRDIVSGKESLPNGLRAGMLIKGVEEYATQKNDIDLLRSLAVSPLVAETSVHAQELRLLAERDKGSVLSQMQEVASERAKVFEKRTKKKANKAIKEETAKIKKEVEKVKINKYDWNNFIKSIEC